MSEQKQSAKRVQDQNRALVEDLCHGCCPSGNYCTLKEILARMPRNARTLVLIKCIEKLKYERGKAEGRDIGWNAAFHIWVDEGYAEVFAKLYSEEIRIPELYRQVIVAHQE